MFNGVRLAEWLVAASRGSMRGHEAEHARSLLFVADGPIRKVLGLHQLWLLTQLRLIFTNLYSGPAWPAGIGPRHLIGS